MEIMDFFYLCLVSRYCLSLLQEVSFDHPKKKEKGKAYLFCEEENWIIFSLECLVSGQKSYKIQRIKQIDTKA